MNDETSPAVLLIAVVDAKHAPEFVRVERVLRETELVAAADIDVRVRLPLDPIHAAEEAHLGRVTLVAGAVMSAAIRGDQQRLGAFEVDVLEIPDELFGPEDRAQAAHLAIVDDGAPASQRVERERPLLDLR